MSLVLDSPVLFQCLHSACDMYALRLLYILLIYLYIPTQLIGSVYAI